MLFVQQTFYKFYFPLYSLPGLGIIMGQFAQKFESERANGFGNANVKCHLSNNAIQKHNTLRGHDATITPRPPTVVNYKGTFFFFFLQYQ